MELVRQTAKEVVKLSLRRCISVSVFGNCHPSLLTFSKTITCLSHLFRPAQSVAGLANHPSYSDFYDAPHLSEDAQRS